jgi:hypothetical protein
VKVEFSLNDAVFRQAVSAVVKPTIRRAIRELKSRMQTRFQLPKSGRMYYRPTTPGFAGFQTRGGRYRASAKGEAPAIRTGRLFRSLLESYPSDLEAVLTVDTPYAAILENPNKLDRPFVRPSIMETVAALNSGGRLLSTL